MNNETAYELLKRGEDLLRTGNPAQAAIVLERALKQEPGRSSIHEALGRACFDSGRYVRAAREFQTVIDLYPTNSYAHYCLSRALGKLGYPVLSRRHERLASAMGYVR